MSVYIAPLREMLFAMKEVGGLDAICAQPDHEETTPDLVEAILQEALKNKDFEPIPDDRPLEL